MANLSHVPSGWPSLIWLPSGSARAIATTYWRCTCSCLARQRSRNHNASSPNPGAAIMVAGHTTVVRIGLIHVLPVGVFLDSG